MLVLLDTRINGVWRRKIQAKNFVLEIWRNNVVFRDSSGGAVSIPKDVLAELITRSGMIKVEVTIQDIV